MGMRTFQGLLYSSAARMKGVGLGEGGEKSGLLKLGTRPVLKDRGRAEVRSLCALDQRAWTLTGVQVYVLLLCTCTCRRGGGEVLNC